MGDAAGIGPEIVLKSLAEMGPDAARCVVIGDLAHLAGLQQRFGLELQLTPMKSAARGVAVCDLANLPSEVSMGLDAPETGRAAAENIEAAVRLWREGEIGAGTLVLAEHARAGCLVGYQG